MLVMEILQLLLVCVEIGERLEDVGKSRDLLLEVRIRDKEVGELAHLQLIDGHEEAPRPHTPLQAL